MSRKFGSEVRAAAKSAGCNVPVQSAWLFVVLSESNRNGPTPPRLGGVMKRYFFDMRDNDRLYPDC
jgi:hypothetical protein